MSTEEPITLTDDESNSINDLEKVKTPEEAFAKKILTFYKNHGRSNLPWRKTTDRYQILVSEV